MRNSYASHQCLKIPPSCFRARTSVDSSRSRRITDCARRDGISCILRTPLPLSSPHDHCARRSAHHQEQAISILSIWAVLCQCHHHITASHILLPCRSSLWPGRVFVHSLAGVGVSCGAISFGRVTSETGDVRASSPLR